MSQLLALIIAFSFISLLNRLRLASWSADLFGVLIVLSHGVEPSGHLSKFFPHLRGLLILPLLNKRLLLPQLLDLLQKRWILMVLLLYKSQVAIPVLLEILNLTQQNMLVLFEFVPLFGHLSNILPECNILPLKHRLVFVERWHGDGPGLLWQNLLDLVKFLRLDSELVDGADICLHVRDRLFAEISELVDENAYLRYLLLKLLMVLLIVHCFCLQIVVLLAGYSCLSWAGLD